MVLYQWLKDIVNKSGASTLAWTNNLSGCDPTNMPSDVTWQDAKGFYIEASGSDGSHEFFITFETPLGSGFRLYKLPAWAEMTYTIVGSNTIQVQLDIIDGVLDPSFVLAQSVTAPVAGGGFPSGAIAGIVVGSVAAIALIVYLMRRRKVI